MAKRQRRPGEDRRPRSGRGGLRAAAIVVIAIALTAFTVSLLRSPSSLAPEAPVTVATKTEPAPATDPAPSLGDEQLQGAADALLAAINPTLSENGHFTPFATDKLR